MISTFINITISIFVYYFRRIISILFMILFGDFFTRHPHSFNSSSKIIPCRKTARIIVHHRIILTVCIQIQPVPAVHILLYKSSKHRIIKPCPQIILPAGLVILLSRVEDSVGEFFPAVLEHAKRIVLIPVFYLPAASRDVGSAILLIQMIVVIATLFSVPAFRNRHRDKTFLHLRAYFRCYHRYSS